MIMTGSVKKDLISIGLPIKYAGAIVYALFPAFSIIDFTKKWWKPSDMYRKTDRGSIEFKDDARGIITQLLVAAALFTISYLI